MTEHTTHKDQITHLYGVIDRLEKRITEKDALLHECMTDLEEINTCDWDRCLFNMIESIKRNLNLETYEDTQNAKI